jgi:hypothetical protein
MPPDDVSNFTVRKPLFPEDRPDVLPTEPKEEPMTDAMKAAMTPDAVIDMEIAGMVTTRLESSKQWRRIYRLIWDKCWEHMKGRYDRSSKAAWQSTTFMPMTSKVVEVIVSNLHSALLSPEMPVEWQTRRADLDPLIRSHNEVIQVDFDKSKAKAHLTDFLRNLCIMGTAIGEVGYAKEEEIVMIKQRLKPSPMDDMLRSMGVSPGEEFVPTKMLVKDFATIKNVDPYNIYPQPRHQDFSKNSWVIHKSKITNRELVIGSRNPDYYYRFDNVTDDMLSGSGYRRVAEDDELQSKRFTLLDYNLYQHFLDPDREHELLTYYGQIPIWYLKPDLMNDKKHQYDSVPGCIKVVDGQYVIWKRISPWRDGEPPYFKGNYIRIPDEFYGIGVAELVLGLQIEKNEIRNSRMDNINLSMNKIMAVMKDMVPPGEWNRLKSEPGAIWLFKGVDDIRKAIQQVEFGNVTQDSWLASKEVDNEAEEVTAANSVTQGAGGQSGDVGGKTFRGQLLNVQQATGRWMLYARMFEWMGLSPAMKKFYQRIYQFKSYEDVAEILGENRAQEFEFLAPEMLDKVAKLVPLGVMTMENKGVKLAQMDQFAKMWMGSPFFKQIEMARRMWVEMGNPEPDSVLFSDEEMKQYNEFKKALSMQGMGGPPGGMPPGGPPQGPGLVGPNGSPIPRNVFSGGTFQPQRGVARPPKPAQGPGSKPSDMVGRPIS